MDFNPLLDEVQDMACVDVETHCDCFRHEGILGSHFWTSGLILTQEMTVEVGGRVTLGWRSFFGFGI